MAAPKRALLFGNPSAQSGRAAVAIERAVAVLASRGIGAEVVPTEPAGRTPALVARELSTRRPDLVCELGGDGTFAEVASGLFQSGLSIPLGMFPMGTANDQGRSFGLLPGAGEVEAHAEAIAAGHEIGLDVGRITGHGGGERHERLFFDSASFGLAPEILAARNRTRAAIAEGPLPEIKDLPILGELFRDQALYVGAAFDRLLASIVEPSRFSAVVTTDRFERSWLELTDLVVKATPIFAGAWVLDPACEPDDGLFELVPVESHVDWVTRVASDLAAAPLRPDGIGILRREHLAAARFSIDLGAPGERAGVRAQLDGEEWIVGDRFEIEVLPRAIRLLVPAGFSPPWKR